VLISQNCQDFWIGDDEVDYTRIYDLPPEGESGGSSDHLVADGSCRRLESISTEAGYDQALGHEFERVRASQRRRGMMHMDVYMSQNAHESWSRVV
jgi:hypothetical protein